MAAVKAIVDRWGKIDILHNNAGVTVRKTMPDLTEKEWDFVLDVGLKGLFLFSKHVIPVMEANGGGSIINTGSGWGLKGGDQAAAYCAVKGGIVNVTRAMAIDHGPKNIRVNSVNPGDTDTDAAGRGPSDRRGHCRRRTHGRLSGRLRLQPSLGPHRTA